MRKLPQPPAAPSQPAPTTLEPAWDVARLFPAQGTWSDEEYLALPTNHLVEFSHGWLEVLPLPTQSHQLIVLFLYRALLTFAESQALGVVLVAPLRVRLWPGKFREPDIVFMRTEQAHRRSEAFWDGADLVMEVVSPENRQHDLETKRRDYAQAGIPEYWIVDPQEERILVLALAGHGYQLHGAFGRGEMATSPSLPGFTVSVDAVFAAAQPPAAR